MTPFSRVFHPLAYGAKSYNENSLRFLVVWSSIGSLGLFCLVEQEGRLRNRIVILPRASSHFILRCHCAYLSNSLERETLPTGSLPRIGAPDQNTLCPSSLGRQLIWRDGWKYSVAPARHSLDDFSSFSNTLGFMSTHQKMKYWIMYKKLKRNKRQKVGSRWKRNGIFCILPFL